MNVLLQPWRPLPQIHGVADVFVPASYPFNPRRRPIGLSDGDRPSVSVPKAHKGHRSLGTGRGPQVVRRAARGACDAIAVVAAALVARVVLSQKALGTLCAIVPHTCGRARRRAAHVPGAQFADTRSSNPVTLALGLDSWRSATVA